MKKIFSKYGFLTKNSGIHIFLLIIITLVLTTKDIMLGDFPFSDSSAHAMNGVYIHDLIKEMKWSNIYDFTLQYYGRYPRLTLPFHPPFFPLIEAFFFFFFGISPATAKLSVVFFALLSVTVWYKLIKSLYCEKIAFFSGILLITTPTVVLWSRQVMLEMPALAMIILSMYFLHTSVDLGKKNHLLFCAICMGLALLTKQTTVFIFPLAFSYILIKKKYSLLFTKTAILSCLIGVIFLLLLAMLTMTFADFAIELVVMDTSLQGFAKASPGNLFYYFKLLPNLITTPLLILSCISVAVMTLKKVKKKTLLFSIWLFWVYVFITFISIKNSRYAFFWIPPFCLFAGLMYDEFKIKSINISAILLGALCIYQFVLAYQLKAPFVDGYEKAAKFVTDNPKGNTVLVSAYYEGNFIFHVRRHDTDGSSIVLRADKILPDAWRFKDGYKETDVYNILENYGINYIVVEDKESDGLPELKLLRRVINSGNFILRKKIGLTSNITRFRGANILIYEYNKDVSLKKKTLIMDMPKMKRKISIPLKGLPDHGSNRR